ncbi:hypothetical protein Pan153_32940 [Gimesia panareensis]|uniref:Glycosyltransferase RgtA/B/C/D-like domain-containing protein n=1 Tax=Gimesia panareensis TaxID=2527978 RepID=A0A518FQK1_9PLAN|nr:hypothetical protein [Gimesia panareensis]QDV18634.1 hypothetical protein Pan153_32940 [Gimesia panareensis]
MHRDSLVILEQKKEILQSNDELAASVNSSSVVPEAGKKRLHFAVTITSGVILWGLFLGQFLTKPVHIDDTNFLRLAEGARQNWFQPHSITINWTGKTVPAFEVLSNPPGIGWYLAPVLQQPIWVMHLWMSLWLIPLCWGARQLLQVYAPDYSNLGMLLILTSPVVVLSAQSFLPDLPMLACTLAGLGGYANKRKGQLFWAFVAGSAGCFRYSGVLIIGVLILMARKSGWRTICLTAIAGGIPLALLAINDLVSYGQWHLPAMFLFQNDTQHKLWDEPFHNLVAGLAMLGGAVVLPILCWNKWSPLLGFIGAWLGLNAAFLTDLTLAQSIPTVLFAMCGGIVASSICNAGSRYLSLSGWACFGFLLLTITRFAATRYWMAFFPAFVLLGLINKPSKRRVGLCIALSLVLSLGMAIDDYEFACSQRDAAKWVTSHAPQGHFSGHWGWQYYLESAGWSPIERDAKSNGPFAVSTLADPQTYQLTTNHYLIKELSLPDRWPGPRVHCLQGRSGYHGGGRALYAPWTLSNAPYDRILVYGYKPLSEGRADDRN